MSDTPAPYSHPEDNRHEAVRPADRLEAVRSSGRWMPWAGLILASIWWACVALALVTVFDISWVLAQPPITLAVGGLVSVLPGFLVIMAAFMARETARSAAANTLVLQSAAHLLNPVDATALEAETLASRIASSAQEVDQTLSSALSAMKGMAGELGDERLRLESVSYATADNARDLAAQLGNERAALEGLIRDLKAHGEMLNEAIPRQAQMMVGAAKSAGDEIARADTALEQRLQNMRASSDMLAGELQRLEGLAGDAAARSDTLLKAISRIETSLDASRETVETAVRSSEVAVVAAGQTGEALQSAMASALDDARRASAEIQNRTREASEDAAMQIANLRQSAEQAAQALKSVGTAAREENARTEQRLSQTSAALQRHSASTLTPPAPPSRPVSPPLARPPAAETTISPDEALFASPPPDRAPMVSDAPSRVMDDELFEPPQSQAPPSVPAAIVRSERHNEAAAHHGGGQIGVTPAQVKPADIPPPFDPLESENDGDSAPNAVSADAVPTPAPRRDAAWTSILSDMDRSEAGSLPREETAEAVIRKLETSGIALSNIFRPRDKKKIASAAQRGDNQRRSAIASAARSEVERVEKRLRADAELTRMAREFVNMEAPDAMAALERTQRSNRNASPRLSAFLLLDAAIEA